MSGVSVQDTLGKEFKDEKLKVGQKDRSATEKCYFDTLMMKKGVSQRHVY